MKWFVFSDPHGNLTALKQGLLDAGYDESNEQHMLLGLGDYFDRGNENVPMFNFLYKKFKEDKIKMLLGNHDSFLLAFLNGEDNGLFNMINNGMLNTVNEFSGLNVSQDNLHLMYHAFKDAIWLKYPKLRIMLKHMEHSYEIGNYVFTHAGMSLINNKWYIDNWADTPYFIQNFDTKGRVYVFGHWHGYKLKRLFGMKAKEGDIFKYDNFIGIDAMTNETNKVNVLIIQD